MERHKRGKILISFVLSIGVFYFLFFPSNALAGTVSIPLTPPTGYATIRSAGIEFINTGDDNQNAGVNLKYKIAGETIWRDGHPLVRIQTNRYIGSLFFLRPSTVYDFKIIVHDPDGVVGSNVFTGQVQTRSDVVYELPRGSETGVLYVSPGGDDTNSGTSPAQALRTIQRAVNLAQAGYRIIVGGGLYRENVAVTGSGTATQPIVIESAQTAYADSPCSSGLSCAPAILDGSSTQFSDLTPDWAPVSGHPGYYYATLSGGNVPIYLAYDTAGGRYEKIYSYYSIYYSLWGGTTLQDYFAENYIRDSSVPEQRVLLNIGQLGVEGGWYFDESTRRLYLRLPDSSDLL